MRKLEYVLSVMMALLVLGGLLAWTQVSLNARGNAFSCRPGKASPPVILRGMNIYPRCPGGKQS